jgi:hypothetical protein
MFHFPPSLHPIAPLLTKLHALCTSSEDWQVQVGAMRNVGHLVSFSDGHAVMFNDRLGPVELYPGGKELFQTKYNLLRPDTNVVVEGRQFFVGEDLRVSYGVMRRGAVALCVVCLIRCTLDRDFDPEQVAELLQLPPSRTQTQAPPSTKTPSINLDPQGNCHAALLLIRTMQATIG